ncbi:tyrosine-protein kinase RYK isoform X2 [Callorhinchus milii]|uniref:Tyrosine-protein kinase RYK n=1 Tax=Callorhinchus milii TaxID=7868 RepID=A0A4W3IHA8_CALMI|nr:tyrosine-protein kinase RYK isoform X2 [Callorhinchus milii]|eukprot:gi/632934332/ref/XP_007908166.1/ PREDICTED: tyrosine-protein kinase RYK isoform X2 [Callorhinchus milii]
MAAPSRWGQGVALFLWRRRLLLVVWSCCCCCLCCSGSLALSGPEVNVYMSVEEVRKLIGLDAELYYVRNDVVSHYALSFYLVVPGETNSLHFTWHAKSKVEYKLGFQVDNLAAMDIPQANISVQGEVPRIMSVFRIDLFCTGKFDSEVTMVMQLNLTVNSSKNITVLNFKRRKMCYKKLEQEEKIPLYAGKNSSKDGRASFDAVNAAPTTSTRVFYISVGVCCAVIFLVAIILAVLHLHSMKRVELDDSMSDSASSQGLSQPSTQTTQYLRADTPNNAAPVTRSDLKELAGCSPEEERQNGVTQASKKSGYPTLRIEKNDLKSVTLVEAKGRVKDIAISRERVTLKDVLQEGTFGRIFHGVLVDEKDSSKEKYVFAKTVKDHASEVQVTMMLTESCKLRGLHHRNLLPISHVCIEDGEKPMVLLPYMNWGNLKLFLRQCKLAEANNPQAISQQDLVHMAIQIACGMSYLARREVIHKDLAARNCVIDDGLQVKITDNALSRDLFPMDYHCLGDNENRPVRWMALESLVNNEFSSASDVWAFGVTLWELMTLGQTPYVDIDPFEMAAYLKDGYRIAQPINCPDELFAVMACCWALDREERPKFQQLVQCLTEFHAALGAYV